MERPVSVERAGGETGTRRPQPVATLPQEVFDDLALLAAAAVAVPVALVTVAQAGLLWLKAAVGVDPAGVALDDATCGQALGQPDLFVASPRPAGCVPNPLLGHEPPVRFCVGMPLRSRVGEAIGTLWALDHAPRDLAPRQCAALRALARAFAERIALHRDVVGLRRSGALQAWVADALREVASTAGVFAGEAFHALLLIDRHYTVRFFNADAARYAREVWGRELATGDSLLDLGGPAADDLHRHLQRALRGERVTHSSPPGARDEGRALEHRYIPVPLDAADADGVAMSLVDAGERLAAARAGAYNRAATEALAQHPADAILVLDPGGRVEYASPSVMRVLGYAPEALIDRPLAEHAHPDDAERVAALLMGSGPAPGPTEFHFRNATGSWVLLEVHLTDRRDDPELGALVCGLRDVTDVRRTKTALLSKSNELAKFTLNLRQVHRLSTARYDSEEALLADVLATGCEIFGLPVGLYTTVDGNGYTVRAARGGGDFLKPGVSFEPGDTFCERVAAMRETLAFPYIPAEPELARRLFHELLEYESYVGAPVRLHGPGATVHGVLSFLARRPQSPDFFGAHEHEIVELLAASLGRFLAELRIEAERDRALAALRESEERYALGARGASDGLWDWNLATNGIYFSPRWKAMLGYDEAEIGASPEDWLSRVHPEDAERLTAELTAHVEGQTPSFENEHRIRHRNGIYRWMLSRGMAVRDPSGRASRIAGTQTDITQRKMTEEQLLLDAFHDPLTGLANRALFVDRLGQAIVRRRRWPEQRFAVLFLDLDRFKVVNDSLGHLAGDQLLVEAARRLEGCLRPHDTVARLGGDEFVVLIEQVQAEADAIAVAERVQAALSAPYHVAGTQVCTTASIGIALGADEAQRPEDVVQDADMAMYRAKQRGKACYELFDSGMPEMS